MIKFFRKIRQNLLLQNKTSKYFKYAIGEIILVVIGILIALQINNWNEHYKDNKKLGAFILQYKDALIINKLIFNSEIKFAQKKIDEQIEFLKMRDFSAFSADSLEQKIETFYIFFEADKLIYESFINTQIKEFGIYDSIIKNMQEYYTWGYANLLDNVKTHNESIDQSDYFWRFEQDDYEFSYEHNKETTIQSSSVRKEKLISLIKKPRARNFLKIDNRKKREWVENLKYYDSISQLNIDQINRVLKFKDND